MRAEEQIVASSNFGAREVKVVVDKLYKSFDSSIFSCYNKPFGRRPCVLRHR